MCVCVCVCVCKPVLAAANLQKQQREATFFRCKVDLARAKLPPVGFWLVGWLVFVCVLVCVRRACVRSVSGVGVGGVGVGGCVLVRACSACARVCLYALFVFVFLQTQK